MANKKCTVNTINNISYKIKGRLQIEGKEEHNLVYINNKKKN